VYFIHSFINILFLDVLVSGVDPLRVYIHEEGLTRLSTSEYALDNIDNKFAHLTNYSINKKAEQFKTAPVDGEGSDTDGFKWSLAAFRKWLAVKESPEVILLCVVIVCCYCILLLCVVIVYCYCVLLLCTVIVCCNCMLLLCVVIVCCYCILCIAIAHCYCILLLFNTSLLYTVILHAVIVYNYFVLLFCVLLFYIFIVYCICIIYCELLLYFV
jgi:Tubulin-tyrosine ligase family